MVRRSGLRGPNARHSEERGAAAVELALVLPILVLLFFGIVEFGRGYNAKIELTAAVREGARAAALSSGDPATLTKAAAPGLTPSSMVVTVVTPCPATGPGTTAVKATYPFHYSIPFFGTNTVTLGATGVMRCGG